MAPGFDFSPLPVAIVSGPSHLIDYANAAFCNLLGQSADLLVDTPIEGVLPDEKNCTRLIERVRRTAKSQIHTEPLDSNPAAILWSYQLWPINPANPDGGIVLQVSKSATYHEKTVAMNEALMLSLLDQHELRLNAESANAQLVVEIGERKQVELALVSTQRALAQANQLLDDKAAHLEELVRLRTSELRETVAELESFSYSIAHDLRAPLRSMAGFAEILLLDHLGQLDHSGQLCLKRIVSSAGVMDQLIRDVLSYGQILRATPILESVDVNLLIQETTEYYPVLAQPGADIRIEGPFPTVRGNAALLMQVFSHLLGNAIKFSRPDERPKVRVWAESGNALVKFFVSDDGIGISKDQHQKIFGVFEQLDRVQDGTGIGLAIVKKAVERMGGKVGVISELDRGATFWFEAQLGSAPLSQRSTGSID